MTAPFQGTSANIRINFILSESGVIRLDRRRYSTGLSSFKFFLVVSESRTSFERECVMALQGHPRSMIVAPVESAYATSYRWSIITLVLSCPVSEILQVSGQRDPPLFHPNFRVFPFLYLTLKCSVEPGWHGSPPSSRGEGSVYLDMLPGFRALHLQIRY